MLGEDRSALGPEPISALRAGSRSLSEQLLTGNTRQSRGHSGKALVNEVSNTELLLSCN